MAVRPEEVYRALDARYPFRTAEDWDNSGWQIHTSRPIERCLVALDPSPAAVAEAVARQADLLVTHHPLFFPHLHALDPDTPAGGVVRSLLEHNLGLLSMHTPFDLRLDGNSGALAARLGLQEVRLLQPAGEEVFYKEVAFDLYRTHRQEDGLGLGAVGEWPEPPTLDEALGRIKEALGGPPLLVSGDGGKISRVAVMAGSAGDLIPAAAAAGADLFVGGDLKYHARLEADPHLVCVDPGHRATEQPGVERLAEVLREVVGGGEGGPDGTMTVDVFLEEPGHIRVV